MWPPPNNKPYITVPVMMCLSKIATYTESALSKSLLLCDGIKYNNILQWYDEFQSQKLTDESSDSKGLDDHKVPAFKVPTFLGNTLKSNKWLKRLNMYFATVRWKVILTILFIATIIHLGVAHLTQDSAISSAKVTS